MYGKNIDVSALKARIGSGPMFLSRIRLCAGNGMEYSSKKRKNFGATSEFRQLDRRCKKESKRDLERTHKRADEIINVAIGAYHIVCSILF